MAVDHMTDRQPPDRSRIGRAKRRQFLDVLRMCANVTAAARAGGVSRASWYRLRERDPAFARDWQLALDAGIDALEDEAMRRAFEGNVEPVFYQGQQVGSVRKYSDSMLMFLLKARRPQRYRERVGVEVSDDLQALLRAVDGATRPGASDAGVRS